MCVCATATRRRRQMRLDKRYKKRDPVAAAKRDAILVAKQKAMVGRKAAKG